MLQSTTIHTSRATKRTSPRDVPSAAGPVRMLVPPFNFEGMNIPMRAIPAVGEHTDAILGELGIEDTTIRQWRAEQII